MSRAFRVGPFAVLVATCFGASACAVGGSKAVTSDDLDSVGASLDAGAQPSVAPDAASTFELDASEATRNDETGAADDAEDRALDASTGGQDVGTIEHDAGVDEPPIDPPATSSCEPTSGCHAARYLGELSGDVASKTNVLEADGSRAEWLSVRLREDSNANKSVHLGATLTVQGDADYDLLVYVPDSADGAQCDAPTEASTTSSSSEHVDASWDDAWLGSDDSRTVTIEVRHVSGSCAPWKLDVRGP